MDLKALTAFGVVALVAMYAYRWGYRRGEHEQAVAWEQTLPPASLDRPLGGYLKHRSKVGPR